MDKSTENNEEKKDIGMQFFSFAQNVNNQPIFTESGRKEWINYGDNNLYPRYLIDLLNKSSKHNSIVKRKTDMTAGSGWVDTVSNSDFIKNSTGKENLNKIAFKNAYDLNTYGCFAILITWSKDRKSIARVKYIDASSVRIAKEIDETTDPDRYKRQEEDVEFYYISSDWSQTKKDKYIPKLVQGYSEEYNDEPTQLIYAKEYRAGIDFYTLPDYISSIDWIELDKEIANFHLNSAQNGFTPSMAINFKNGIPSQEEQNRFHKKIQDKYAGSNNASKVFITYSDSPDQAPDFLPIEANSNDTRFIQLEETISTNIAIAHRIPPVVIGVLVSGKLGSTNELYEAESLFQRNVIDQKQFQIEEVFTMLSEVNGVGEMELIKTEPLSPFTIETDIDIEEDIDDEMDEEEKE